MYDKSWYEKNKEHVKQYAKQYHKENKEVAHQRYLNNKERRLQLAAIWKEQHRGHIKQQAKTYAEQNRHVIRANVRKRQAAKIQAIPGWYEQKKIAVVYKKAVKLNLHVDHIIPLLSDTVCGLHCWDNLQLLDKQLNKQKSNNYQQDW